MAKAKLNYTVRTTQAPGSMVNSTIPVIIDRREPVELETVVENCIDRGRIAGLKPTAAKGIAEGVAAQIKWAFERGLGVAFGQYFYGRPYLSGTVDSNGRMGEDNSINIRLYKGNAWKLTRNDFSFSFDGAGDAVTVDNVFGDTDQPGGNTYGQIVAGAPVVVNGRNFYSAGDTDKVVFDEVGDGEGHVEVAAFNAQSDALLSFAWPSGLESGKSYAVTVERTDMNGVKRTSAARTVKVVGSAPAPTPIWTTEDGQVKAFSASDDETGETFTWGDLWKVLGEGFRDSEAGWFPETALIQTTPESEGAALEVATSGDGELQLRPEDVTALAPGDYPNAVLSVGFAHNSDEGLVTESMSLPVHLVVNG